MKRKTALLFVLAAATLGACGAHAAASPSHLERAGHHGAPTFVDHHTVSGPGPRIPDLGQVSVSCKVYDPSIPSSKPDGYWYRIASKPWDNRYYAVANTFFNGDPLNGPYSHNTDFHVPDC